MPIGLYEIEAEILSKASSTAFWSFLWHLLMISWMRGQNNWSTQ